MKSRHVYSVADLPAAQAALRAAREAGLHDDDLSLVARADIELDSIPDQLKEADTDFKPAAMRGAAAGGGTGLLVGLAAAAFPPLGVTLAGAALITLGSTLVGTWVAALVGSTVEDPLRRKFEEEIQAGKILLVIDVDAETLPRAEAAIKASGGTPLEFDTLTALS